MAEHFDLVDIKLFVNIADSNSLTRAAQLSNMSLPSASTRIKHFEDSLGVKLLYRTSHGVTLTPAGQKFLQHARLVVNQLENLRGDLQEYVRGAKGHVRIFANTSATTEFLPLVLPSFLATHPDVSIDLRERLSPDILCAVKEGKVDIGIVAGAVRAENVRTLPYHKNRLVLATARNHPLSKHKSISFEDTLDFEYVGLCEGSAIHAFLTKVANELNKELKIRIQLRNFEAVCRMVEANVGIAVLPDSFARRHSKIMKIDVVPFIDEWAERNLQICVRSLEALPKYVRELVDALIADGRGVSA
jgi:DNA-binding transcriptional LysR family regulator